MSNVGRIITDSYCNGFFGRDFTLSESVIVAEGDCWLVIRKPNGLYTFTNFQFFDYERNENGTLKSDVETNVRSDKSENIQEYINNWCQ